MLVADLRMHTFVNTPHGKSLVIATDTPRISPTEFDFVNTKVRCFFEPNKLYPRGIDRTFLVSEVNPWVEPVAFASPTNSTGNAIA